MITEYGKILRIYRLNNGMILKDMADKLNVPSSYLSALEMGRKPVTKDFLDKLLEKYDFTNEEQEKLKHAAELSASAVKVNLQNANAEKRDMAFNFARKFDGLDEETVKKIMEFLK